MVFGQILTPAPTLPPFFMILIIPNIVQNLYLNLSMPFILGLHPPYPTSPTYPKPCYPTSPTPTPDRTPPPPDPHPTPTTLKFFIFFEFSQKLYFSVHIHPDPQPDAPSFPRPDPPKKYFFFGIFTKASILRASSVNGKTLKKSVPKRRGGVWCVDGKPVVTCIQDIILKVS